MLMSMVFENLFGTKPARVLGLLALCVAVAVLTVSCVQLEDDPLETPFRLHGNQVYVEGDAHERHRLDVYLPVDRQEGETFPVLLWFHGGSWNIGNKYGIPLGMREFAISNRIAFVSANYRYSTQALAPAQIHDAKAVVRFLRANADEFNLDTSNIVASGFSAGGYLAAYLGLTPGNAEFEGGDLGFSAQSSAVQAVATFAVPFNFSSNSEWNGFYNIVGIDWQQSVWLLTRCLSVRDCPDEARQYSPTTYVTSDSPPFYIQHGTFDLIIPISQAQEMCNLLRDEGSSCEVDILANAFHDALVTDKFKNFVLEQLASPAPSDEPPAPDLDPVPAPMDETATQSVVPTTETGAPPITIPPAETSTQPVAPTETGTTTN